MVLITGGAWQGKTEFAKKYLRERAESRCMKKKDFPAQNDRDDIKYSGGLKIVNGETVQTEELQRADLVTDMHLWIAKLLRENKDVYQEINEMTEQNPEIVITVNELGCGVVPIDAFDRNWRETTGRICCLLAQKSTEVYRVTCGIATRIK